MPEPIHVLEVDRPFQVPGRQQPVTDAATQKLYAEVQGSIVSIEVDGRRNGSGFAFERPGLIATDWHVVNRGKEFVVITSDGGRFRARLKDADDLRDLAFLQIEQAPPESLRPLPAGDVAQLRNGSRVTGFGHPDRSVPVYVSPGTFVEPLSYLQHIRTTNPNFTVPSLTDARDQADLDTALSRTMLYTRVHARHGNSGGPLLDANGKVVGVADLTADNKNFSHTLYTPVSDLTALINRRQPKFQFDYRYQGSDLAQSYLDLISSRPLLTTGLTAGAGYLGYRGLGALTPRAGGMLSLALGLNGGLQLLDDAPLAWNSTNNRDLLKYSTASLADSAMLAGSAMRYFSPTLISVSPTLIGGIEGQLVKTSLSRTGKIGMGILAAGLVIRVAAEFIPNRLVQTGMKRTDGDTRPLLPLYEN